MPLPAAFAALAKSLLAKEGIKAVTSSVAKKAAAKKIAKEAAKKAAKSTAKKSLAKRAASATGRGAMKVAKNKTVQGMAGWTAADLALEKALEERRKKKNRGGYPNG